MSLRMTDGTPSRRKFLTLGLATAVALAVPPTLSLGGQAAAEEAAAAGTRYYFGGSGVQRRLSPTLERDLRRPSVSGSRLLLDNPNRRPSGVERSQAERFDRRAGQAIRRLERVPGARDNRIDRRIRTLRGAQRRISRELRDTR